MSETPKKFYVTTPIYYVNARPHIGHAYTTIVADVLARRHRLLGDDVFFLTGTDEHGQKIERSAAAAGIPPQQFADGVAAQFKSLWDRMGLTYSKFIRTTDPAHALGVQKLFSELYARGFIYLSTYTGAYCVSDEAFVDVPVGQPCPDCGRLTEQVTEENFFFKLSAFQASLINLIESGEMKIENVPRKNEVLSFLRGTVDDRERIKAIVARMSTSAQVEFYEKANGAISSVRFSASGEPYVPGALKDLSISRSSFTWGIPVPEPAASAAAQKHVIYVWLDALANYMTAIGYGTETAEAHKQFAHYWPADLHLVGKEIIRFHCVYWPAFLLAAGLPLPKAITAHGWLLFDNSKMSKSKGNIVRTETILQAFGDEVYGKQFPESTPHERDLFASDVLRYFLLREIPFGQDGSFSFDALVTRYNADLANGYGNLVSRTLKMVNDYFLGSTPQHREFLERTFLVLNPNDINQYTEYKVLGPALAESAAVLQMTYDIAFADLGFAAQVEIVDGQVIRAGVIDSVLRRVAETDAYITIKAPWKLAKSELADDRVELADVLYTAAESIRIITALLYPVLPYATARVWAQLGLDDIEAAARNGELKKVEWGGLKPGTKLGPLAPIFPRADKGLAQLMNDMENSQLTTANSKLEKTSARPEASLKQASTPTPAAPVVNNPNDPAAPPASSALNSLAEPSGALPVAGSHATTTATGPTPSHTEAPLSVAFASTASQIPISAGSVDASPQITIDDFAKVELRVAEVKVCERIPKADKLLRLEVDLGHEQRQILSGIAEFYTPEDLLGRRIIVITNLAPRKMRGLDSHGMLLAASGPEGGKPILATVPEGVPLGSRLK